MKPPRLPRRSHKVFSLLGQVIIVISSFDLFVFRAYHGWAWVPIIACLLGGVLGAIVYIITIELHHKESEDIDNRYRPVSGTDTGEDQL